MSDDFYASINRYQRYVLQNPTQAGHVHVTPSPLRDTPMFARRVQEAQEEHDRETDIEEARRWQEDNAIDWLQSPNLSHDEYTQWLKTFNQQEIEK